MRKTPSVAPKRMSVSDSYTFLIKELEKVDETISNPVFLICTALSYKRTE